MRAVKLAEIPRCPICQKRLLIHHLQRARDCCYPCGRRTTLRRWGRRFNTFALPKGCGFPRRCRYY